MIVNKNNEFASAVQAITCPVVPAYVPDPRLVAQIRAAIERHKLQPLQRAVRAAREVL